MIVQVAGTLTAAQPGYVIVMAHGLGLGLDIPRETYERLPGVGSPVQLFTHLIVREDQWRLIGFATERERAVFLDLIDISGVGVKAALSVMSQLGIQGLAEAVRQGQWKLIQKAPGIGAKMAQRIQLELGTKWGGTTEVLAEPALPPDAGPVDDEVLEALRLLGYQDGEARRALGQVTAEEATERLRQALRWLGGGPQSPPRS
ncbi:Holliday junction DNA helicase motor protein [Sulfobacillus acidophilus TPY]|uniref:Holliday junction branch migration complex subunit RuvA n=1 Tax=Sulfobacillus acidophilus (strain ATCC 700253 / DSM 10332 / NAL) TaxID=679936 RepID=G8TWZ5_SULAD|nr:Holliday junction DNA helicase motor protein [Sulfobacillus acidophilus TPY]AEW04903.1 Holliday junction DNA helicase subunit RuvA [Sulfobacillus acidophilus DSM 10332]